MDKELRKRIGHFHSVDPEELSGFQEVAEWLEAILHEPCSVWEEEGKEFLIEIRALVDRVRGLKIEIYPDEHPPPHFHVKSPNVDASFTIESCELLSGEIQGTDLRKIRFWFKRAKPLLIEKWNDTRPTDCQVGFYNDA
jgi:hypothetical protein